MSTVSVFFRAELILKSDLWWHSLGLCLYSPHTDRWTQIAVWLKTSHDIKWLSLYTPCIFKFCEYYHQQFPSKDFQEKQLWFEKICDNPDGFIEDKSTWSFKIKVFQYRRVSSVWFQIHYICVCVCVDTIGLSCLGLYLWKQPKPRNSVWNYSAIKPAKYLREPFVKQKLFVKRYSQAPATLSGVRST